MPGAFLYDNVARFATLSSNQATVGAMPLSNLQDPQPRRRARLMGSTTSIIANMGVNVSVDCAALISTTLGAGATVRARVGSEAALVEAAPLVGLDFLQGTPSSMAAWSAARGGAGGAGEATYFDWAGNLTEATAGEWRIDHDPATLERRGLLLEPASTNHIRNSRAGGAVVGGPDMVGILGLGALPTNWTAYGDGVDLRWNVANFGFDSGVPYVDLRLVGTSHTGVSVIVRADEAYAAASVGQNWTHSFYVRRVAGTLSGISQVGAFLTEWSAGPTFLSQQFAAIDVNAPSMGASRRQFSAVLSQPTVSLVGGQISIIPVINTPIDCTFRIALPQLEPKSFVTSAILNPVGAPAVTTRATDFGTLPISVPASFSLFSETRHAAIRSENVVTVLHQTSAGDPITGAGLRSFRAGAASFADGYNVVAGAVIADFVGAAVTAGQVITQASAYAVNDMAYSMNGGAIETDGFGVLPGLSQMQIYQDQAVTHLRRLRLYGSRLSNAQLVALSGTGSTLVPSEVTGDTGAVAAEAEDANQGNVILTLPALAVGRYLRIDITNPTAAFTDIGVLAAGGLWRLLRGTAYGIREGRVMLDRRDRNPFTGAEFPVPAIANPRVAAFTLPSLSTSEARNQHRALVRLLGAAGDALWIAELSDSVAERNRRTIWGAVNAPGEDAAVSRDSFPLSSRAFRVTERL
jgi:hypothetical protein